MIRASLTAVAGLVPVLALAGCGAPARSPGPPGSTAILLENRVDGSCDLTWVNARVDEHPLDLVTIAPPGARPAPLARPVLAPGEHTITISASATCTDKKAEDPAVLHVTQQVYMGKDGGQITISLSPDASALASLKASFDVQGGHVLAPRADGEEVNCRARLPMDFAICRTEQSLARAHERRDVVLALCISDKLKEMRLVKGTLEPGALAAKDGAVRDVAEDATHRVLALAREADFCIGEDSMSESGTFLDRPHKTSLPAFR